MPKRLWPNPPLTTCRSDPFAPRRLCGGIILSATVLDRDGLLTALWQHDVGEQAREGSGVTDGVQVVSDGAVVEVVLDRPPAVQLNAALRAALLAALTAPDRAARAILIRGRGPWFVTGADIPTPDSRGAPDLAALCRAIEGCAIPVAVLLDGPVVGPAAELALAAHLRLARPSARFGFPAASLGLVSGAGGTQRLPRLVGAEQALRLLRASRSTPAAEALALGLVDAVLDAPNHEAAVAQARAHLADASAMSATRDRTVGVRDGRAFLAAVAAAREGNKDALTTALVDCVEAALLLPFDQGLALECALAEERAETPEAAALCHLHFAERRCAETPPSRPLPADVVARLGLCGAALSLVSLALAALARGVPVTVADPDAERLVAFLEAVAARQEAAVQAGRITPAQRDADWARLVPATNTAVLAPATLLVAAPDAVIPPPQPGQVQLVMGQGPLGDGALRLGLPGRMAEIGLPPSAPAEAAGQAVGQLRRFGLMVVANGGQFPFGIAGRMAAIGAESLLALLAMGVNKDAVVSALAGFGQPVAGLPDVPDGVPELALPGDQIVRRWLAALANEGAQLLASGMARSALDIDLVCVHGLGFPRDKGGPMHQAERRGALVVRRDLMAWGTDASIWKPAAAWDAIVSAGRGFDHAVSPE